MFKQISNIYKESSCELLVVGGDIFDRMPTMEELELYFEWLEVVNSCKIQTIIYPGNHEAVKKNTSFLTNLKIITLAATNGYAKIIDDYYSDEYIDIIPYNKLKEYLPQDVDFHNKILCTHVRGEIPPHVHPEVPLELFERWQVVLAGDLHSYENCQRNILYPGSPLTTSFHRSIVDTGVIILDCESLVHYFAKLNLPQLIRKTVSNKLDMIKTEFHHTIYELEGDAADMSAKVDSELLDKKIIRKESKSSLQLTPEMSIKDELGIYLKEVMKLDDSKVVRIKSIYDDYIRETGLE
jgi:DNA repair exonuclease SbcCD nuclease subunit